MKIIKKLPYLMIPFICVACSTQSAAFEKPTEKATEKTTNKKNYSIYYKGESEHWSGNLSIHIAGDKEDDVLELTYKGSDGDEIKIKGTVDLPNGKMSDKDVTLLPDGSTIIHRSTKNGVVPPENYIAEGTIEWDEKVETIKFRINP